MLILILTIDLILLALLIVVIRMYRRPLGNPYLIDPDVDRSLDEMYKLYK